MHPPRWKSARIEKGPTQEAHGVSEAHGEEYTYIQLVSQYEDPPKRLAPEKHERRGADAEHRTVPSRT